MNRGAKKIALDCLVILSSSIFMAMNASAQTASSTEAEFRARLVIPAEARQVIVFAQSSHVDPDWLLTANQYQKLLTDKTFDRMLVELGKDPRYIYTVECTFFFKRYWDSHPQNQDLLRKYVNEGRIRFSGTGITTPDTLMPEGENLVRDYVAGYYWLKRNGMNTDPKAAYYPDSFGHSPSVPSILNALGYKYAAVTRIDGEYFIETDRRSGRNLSRSKAPARNCSRKNSTPWTSSGRGRTNPRSLRTGTLSLISRET